MSSEALERRAEMTCQLCGRHEDQEDLVLFNNEAMCHECFATVASRWDEDDQFAERMLDRWGAP